MPIARAGDMLTTEAMAAAALPRQNFSDLPIDVVDRVPKLQTGGAGVKERIENQIVESINYAHKEGIDKPDAANRTWPEQFR